MGDADGACHLPSAPTYVGSFRCLLQLGTGDGRGHDAAWARLRGRVLCGACGCGTDLLPERFGLMSEAGGGPQRRSEAARHVFGVAWGRRRAVPRVMSSTGPAHHGVHLRSLDRCSLPLGCWTVPCGTTTTSEGDPDGVGDGSAGPSCRSGRWSASTTRRARPPGRLTERPRRPEARAGDLQDGSFDVLGWYFSPRWTTTSSDRPVTKSSPWSI